MLAKVRLALRLTETTFDTEIQSLIDDCERNMEKMGVTVNEEDPQIVTAVIAYVKWQFGENEESDKWREIYDRKLSELKMMSGYTTW